MMYYRITDGARIELSADQYAALVANGKAAMLRPFVVDLQPSVSDGQAVTDAGIVVTEDEARQTWAVRDLTVAELRITVSPRQIRHALNAAGLRASVEAAVAGADQDTRDWWEFATSFDSDHPALLAMAQALGMTDAQVRAVFLAAASA